MSGDEAFRSLRIDPDVEGVLELELPIGRVDLSLILAEPGTTYLRKPFSLRELRGTVASMVGSGPHELAADDGTDA